MYFLFTRPGAFTKLLSHSSNLKYGLKNTGGRNMSGHITSYHKGGGKKLCYRYIDFWRRLNQEGIVIRIEYDPNRSAFVALVVYMNGLVSYILAPDSLKEGQYVFSGLWEGQGPLFKGPIQRDRFLSKGSATSLMNIPVGAIICNIEFRPGYGGQLCRAAGTFAIISKKTEEFVTLRLKSGWSVVLANSCFATIGMISNPALKYKNHRKAGYSRNRNKRPTVRGVAMNPIDHPHGGGEGKASGGPRALSPWGKITKGKKTVTKRKRLRLQSVRFKE